MGVIFWVIFLGGNQKVEEITGINITSSIHTMVSGVVGAILFETEAENIADYESIVDYDCSSLASQLEGEGLTNALGKKSQILEIDKIYQVSKSDKELLCYGEVITTTGTSSLRYRLFKTTEGNVYFEAKEL